MTVEDLYNFLGENRIPPGTPIHISGLGDTIQSAVYDSEQNTVYLYLTY